MVCGEESAGSQGAQRQGCVLQLIYSRLLLDKSLYRMTEVQISVIFPHHQDMFVTGFKFYCLEFV